MFGRVSRRIHSVELDRHRTGSSYNYNSDLMSYDVTKDRHGCLSELMKKLLN